MKDQTKASLKKYKAEVEKAKGEKTPECIEDMKKELASIEEKIADIELDHYYSDSWDQSGQIRKDIDKLKSKEAETGKV